MDLNIRPFNAEVKQLYDNHGHFHDGDAGLDVYVINEQTIEPDETTLIHLQIACETSDGRPYLLMPRSSIAKTPLRLCNSIGLIDGGYRGEIMAVCDNIKDYEFKINKGDRLFQLVSSDLSPITFEIVKNLSKTTRGGGGFGSTGT